MSEEVTREQVVEAVQQVLAEVRRSHSQTLELTPFQKLVGALFTAGCIWVGSTVQSTSVEMAELRERVGQVASDRYTAGDAKREHETIGERMRGIERRVDVVENKL